MVLDVNNTEKKKPFSVSTSSVSVREVFLQHYDFWRYETKEEVTGDRRFCGQAAGDQ